MHRGSPTKEILVASRPLTERQQAILSFIIEAIQTRGFPPTLREIGQAFSIRSTKGVNDHLAALERKGEIRRHPELSRGIEVVHMPSADEDIKRIPLVGRIAAGTPVLATENIEGTYGIDRSLVQGGEFMLSVQGDSMIDAHICDGDYILVRPQETAEDGEIVAAMVDEEATVKRFFRNGSSVRLVPANESMSPIVVESLSNDVRILGKVVAVFRAL
ncbi:MAG: transcriptional repressor LexA [Candidatus Latescibacterota bacterium]|nr:MAG: transcriptional repressor LexA [Candidatus Latescibacterota bacterium]